MKSGQFRTIVIAVLTVSAGLALVMLADVETELAVAASHRIEGAFAILVPALLHSLTVMDRAEHAPSTYAELGIGDDVAALQRDGTRRAGTIIAIAHHMVQATDEHPDGVDVVYVVNHPDGDENRQYPAREVRRSGAREPTGGHRV